MKELINEKLSLLIFVVYGGFYEICCVLIENGCIVNDFMVKGYMVLYFVV